MFHHGICDAEKICLCEKTSKRLVSPMSEAGLNRQKQKSIILSDRQQHCRAIDLEEENPVETWGYREVGS